MRFKAWDELVASGWHTISDTVYRIDTIVFSTYIDDDGKTGIDDAYYWYDEDNGMYVHPFDCYLTDLEEARRYASCFTADMARWTHEHGNGRKFESVAVDVTECKAEMFDGEVEWVSGYAVSCYDWLFATQPEVWHDEEVALHAMDCMV